MEPTLKIPLRFLFFNAAEIEQETAVLRVV